MIALSRTRPASITIFAIAFFASSLIPYVESLTEISDRQTVLQKLYPFFDWSHDAVIVWLSAWLSIALIPIVMVWLSAIRFARWMVTVMTVAKLGGMVLILPTLMKYGLIQPLVWASTMLGLLAAAMLFTPASNHWFAHKGGADPAVFE